MDRESKWSAGAAAWASGGLPVAAAHRQAIAWQNCRARLLPLVALLGISVGVLQSGCSREPAAVDRPAIQPSPAVADDAPPQPSRRAADPAGTVAELRAELSSLGERPTLKSWAEALQPDFDRFATRSLAPFDPNLRKQFAAAIAHAAAVLRSKQAFLLKSNRVELGGPAGELLKSYPAAVLTLVEVAANWPGWSTADSTASSAKPQVFDLLSRLADGVAENQELSNLVHQARVELVSLENDAAVVQVAFPNGKYDIRMQRRGDRWLPADWVDNWASDEQPSATPDGSRQADQLIDLTAKIDDASNLLSQVQTLEEFERLADAVSSRLLAAAGNDFTPPRTVTADDWVTVEIAEPLSEPQRNELLLQIAAASDVPTGGLADGVLVPEQNIYRITVGPVTDVTAFAKRLNFLEIDAVTGRTIQAHRR